MKVLILAGGFGSRLSEETNTMPKPMAEIGGKPILWHIMKIYSYYGFNDFVVLLGYKGYQIKEYFFNYYLHQSDVTMDLANNRMDVHSTHSEPWRITLLETGLNTMTGGRIKKAKDFIGNESFLLTYGDGVSDVDILETIRFHKHHKKLITMTSVQPEGRFGALSLGQNGQVKTFIEKPKGDDTWINGGFFVCQPEVLNYIEGDETIFEREPLEQLACEGQLYSYRHEGFWKCMDTLRDKVQLNELWAENNPKWKVWK
jgi:glucose-1-phosphate cytidylyltransferase